MRARLVSCGVVSALALAAAFEGCGSNDQTSTDGGNVADTAVGGDATSPDDEGGTGGSGASSGTGSSSGSGASGGNSGAGGQDGGASGEGGTQLDAATVVVNPSVYQHHKNGTRDGVYTDPVFTKTAAATTHVLTGFMGTVSTQVYAQPLYVENGPGGKEAFIVATESDHVTAYDATTGATLWDQGPTLFGTQATTSSLPCGQIKPSLGITGTPFIDYSSGQGVIYFDAMTTPDGNMTFKHLVYAVKVADGTILPNWPVDVTAKLPTFDSAHQNQRGALQLVKGVLYVAYGGHDGDCPPYFGWVIGFPVANPQSPTGWHTTGAKGGIWGPGALPTDGTSVFPITGNTAVSGNTWGGGEAVFRLGAGPTFSGKTADYYAPSNWKDMDNKDQDLGGASNVVFDMPAAPTPHLVLVGGKDSNLYLLNRDNLGGLSDAGAGSELLKQSIATSEIKGAPAVYTTSQGTYVAFHIENGKGVGCPNNAAGNLVAVKITTGAGGFKATVAWCTGESGLGSPMVTTTDGTANPIVWAASDHLYAYDGDTGAKIVDGTKTAMGSSVQGWNTPIAAKGRIAVGVNGQLYVFTP